MPPGEAMLPIGLVVKADVIIEAIEAALNQVYVQSSDEPVLAVEADESGSGPEIVLFTTRRESNREKANVAIREAGLANLFAENCVKLPDEIALGVTIHSCPPLN